jgi:branched-chain amino acid transport system ATP-binding protein
MTSPLLTVEGLKTGFGAVTVLHDLSFEVPRGQVTAILGLNGAGKSVTLKTVAGLVPAWRGSIRLGDRDLAGMTPEQRVAAGMGHVTQGRQVFPELSVEENLRVGAYLLRRRSRRRYAELLDRMYTQFPRLSERRDQPAGTMSGGEQAMLAVARSLMNEPELLLVDEPSAGLAPVIVEELLGLLRDVANSGVTILLVEQNVAFALEVADRALIMQRGAIVYGGATSELDRSSLSHYLGIGRLLSSRVAPVPPTAPTAAQGNGRTTVVRRRRVKAAPTLHHKGGGWYTLPDGSTVRGKQAALDALDALRRNGGGP